MAKKKTYQIMFFDRTTAGLFLYELRMWGVHESRYALNKYTFTTKNQNVIDVCTESFKPEIYKIEEAPAQSLETLSAEDAREG